MKAVDLHLLLTLLKKSTQFVVPICQQGVLVAAAGVRAAVVGHS